MATPWPETAGGDRGVPPGALVGACVPLFACPQGFQEAEGGIALARVLPGEQHQLLPECRDAEGPVGQQ